MKELGSLVHDSGTNLDGMLLHYEIQMGGNRWYNFQPRGLNPKTGAPVDSLWLVEARITGGIDVPEPADLPLAALGQIATDQASGFSGMVTGICLHISGCVHATLQPQGKLAETGAAAKVEGFDIRRLVGPGIPVLTRQEIVADQARRPSPVSVKPYVPAMPR